LKKYPSLSKDFSHFIPIANLWKIDLSEAERKHIEGGVYGECDIWLDVVGSIHEWLDTTKEKSLIDFVLDNLWNWDYTEFEEWEILKPKIIKKLERGL